MREVRDLVGQKRAAAAAVLGPAVHAGLVEEAIDDQLTAPREQVEQARRAVRTLEPVLLLDGHPRHPAALGGQRIARAGELLLLDQQLRTGRLPLLRRHDRRHVHLSPSSFRYVVDELACDPWTARAGESHRRREREHEYPASPATA
jgi:hypothetical protein